LRLARTAAIAGLGEGRRAMLGARCEYEFGGDMSTTPFDPAACKRITTEQRCECNEAGEAERAGMAGMKALNLATIDRAVDASQGSLPFDRVVYQGIVSFAFGEAIAWPSQ
jgi:hypothetical protein